MSDISDGKNVDQSRRRMLALLGGSASVGLAGCSALLDDGEDGEDESDYETSEHADKAQAAWDRILDNPAPEDEELRNKAYVEIEEAFRDDGVLMPTHHSKGEFFWYDHVDIPTLGPLGRHHLTHNRTEVEGDSELNLINATFNELDPIMSTDTASGEVIAQMYETLTTFPAGVPEVENLLIESFETSDDELTWTFELKQGVQFHDGSELTADDVKYSFRRVAESPNSEIFNYLLSFPDGLGIEYESDEDGNVVPDSIGLEVIDDHTFSLTLRNPNPAVLEILTYDGFAILPEGIVGDIEGYDGEIDHAELQTETAVGTGPFEFGEWNQGEDVRVVRNDNYHGETASLESVHWEIVEDPEPRFTYAMERNADFFEIPTNYYDSDLIDAEEDDSGRQVGTYGEVENGATLNYLGVPELGTFYFAFNVPNVPLPVREAVAYVMNHEEFVQDILQNRGTPAFSLTPPGMWPTGQEGYESFLEDYPYSRNETDRESARQVLEENGFTDDEPFELNITVYETSAAFQELAENLREKLSGLGVQVTSTETQFATIQDRGEDGDLEMFNLGWIWSWPDPAYGIYNFEPKNTDTSKMPNEANGYYLDWQANLDEEA